LTDFGRIVRVYGDQPGETGLHLKAPWQFAMAIDRRLKVFEPQAREVITGDKRNLEVAACVVWRVVDPVLFLRAAGRSDGAEARLHERVAAGLSDAIGRRDLAALASTEPHRWALDALTSEVTASVAPPARDELGIDVVDVRLRRFNHPLEVRPAVFDLIRSERRQVAARLRAEGEAQYLSITSQANRARDTILAQAEAEAERIRGSAAAESTRLLNEAHSRDPSFFEFVRTLESYHSILDGQTTVVLSSSSPLLKLLAQGPPAEKAEPAAEKAGHPAETAGEPVKTAGGHPETTGQPVETAGPHADGTGRAAEPAVRPSETAGRSAQVKKAARQP
jgi:membrane protease subunit HflC